LALRFKIPILLLALLTVAFLPASAKGQLQWQRYVGNPILLPDPQSGISGYSDPSLLFDGTTFHLWISAGGFIYGNPNVGVRTFYFTSQDGFAWSAYPENPVLRENKAGAWDSGHIETPSVIMIDGQYWLYYTATVDSAADDPANLQLGLATSMDGSTWIRHPENPLLGRGTPASWEGRWIESPSVLKTAPLFYLWYNGVDMDWQVHVGLATSRDGIHWEKYPGNPVFSPDAASNWESAAVYAPQVHKLGDRLVMIYTGLVFGEATYDFAHSSNGIAVSQDGIDWQRLQDEPIFSEMPGAWDSTGAFTLDWTVADEKLLMIYASGGKVGVTTSVITGIGGEDRAPDLPVGYDLLQNYPNPFNESTVIHYPVPAAGDVQLTVFDLKGREIKTLVSQRQSPGTYEIKFSAHNLPSGLYLYRLSTSDFVATRKITILR